MGLNVFVVIAGRTPRAAHQRPIIASLRPPPYASAVSKCRSPSSHAASMRANAPSSSMPWPKNSGAEPTPPKLPQPSMIRGTARPERPSGRVSLRRSWTFTGDADPTRLTLVPVTEVGQDQLALVIPVVVGIGAVRDERLLGADMHCV